MTHVLYKAGALISLSALGASGFLFFGYLARMMPVLALGAWGLLIAINLFGLYLWVCYSDIREVVGIAVVVQLLAGLLLWM